MEKPKLILSRMKPIVELVTEWDAYESNHPGATVAAFCSFYLEKERVRKTSKPVIKETLSEDENTDGRLTKVIGRIGAMHLVYAKLALKEMEGVEFEWFNFLDTLFHQGESRKTDLISYNLLEQSTGNDILNRIKKADFITERSAPNDKRVKLIKLSSKGMQLLSRLNELLQQPSHLIFHGIQEEDKQLIIRLLNETEKKHSKLLTENRNKSLEELIIIAAAEEES